MCNSFFQVTQSRVIYQKGTYKKLEIVATKNNLRIVDVKGDGNCFFHSIARQISLSGIQCRNYTINGDGPYIRKMLIEYLSNNGGTIYAPIYTEIFGSQEEFMDYLEKLKKGDWPGEFAIQATAEMLEIQINILKDAGNWYKINAECPENRVIIIGHIAEYHYVALDKINTSYNQSTMVKANQCTLQNKIFTKAITPKTADEKKNNFYVFILRREKR